MGLPDTRDYTAIPGTSPVQSATINNLQDCVVSLKKNQSESTFGPGTDGDITLDGVVAAPTGMSKSGTVYTLTRDLVANSLTLTGSTTVLKHGGFRIWIKNGLSTSGGSYIDCSGSDANLSTHGAGAPSGTAKGGADGVDGTTGNGANGNNPGGASFGGNGGNGGTSLSGGGTGGTATGPLVTLGRSEPVVGPLMGTLASPAAGVVALYGGAGGAAGGGGGAPNFGGGGGGGGGVGCLAARHVTLASVNDIRCRGGRGGDCTNSSNSGGGGGGGGGSYKLIYQTLTITGGGSLTSAVVCAGGGAGIGQGTQSPPATAGNAGTLYLVPIEIDYVLTTTAPTGVPTALPPVYFEPLPSAANFPANSVIVDRTTNTFYITYDQLTWTALTLTIGSGGPVSLVVANSAALTGALAASVPAYTIAITRSTNELWITYDQATWTALS